jgi:hypothetical protein
MRRLKRFDTPSSQPFSLTSRSNAHGHRPSTSPLVRPLLSPLCAATLVCIVDRVRTQEADDPPSRNRSGSERRPRDAALYLLSLRKAIPRDMIYADHFPVTMGSGEAKRFDLDDVVASCGRCNTSGAASRAESFARINAV